MMPRAPSLLFPIYPLALHQRKSSQHIPIHYLENTLRLRRSDMFQGLVEFIVDLFDLVDVGV